MTQGIGYAEKFLKNFTRIMRSGSVILKHIVKSQNIYHQLQCRFDEGKLARNFSSTVFVVIGVAVARLSHFTQSITIDYQFLCVPNVSIIVFYLSI